MIASYEIRHPNSIGWMATISPVSESYVARRWEAWKRANPNAQAILYAPDGSIIQRHNVKREGV